MSELVMLVAGAIVGIIVFQIVKAVRKSRRSSKPSGGRTATFDTGSDLEVSRDPFVESGPSIGGDLTTVRVGDWVHHLMFKYVVRGVLRFVEGSYRWTEYHLRSDMDNSKKWLSVEDGEDGLEVIMWTAVPDTDLQPTRGRLNYNGVEYRRAEDGSGTASYRGEGSIDVPATGSVQYADYVSESGMNHLSFERFNGGEWEMAVGETLAPDQLTVFPAGSTSSL